MQAFLKNFNFDSFLCCCSRLSIKGHTAESIKKHDEFVKRLWDDLTRNTSRKKSKLKDSSNFHKLNNEVIFLSLEESTLRNRFRLNFTYNFSWNFACSAPGELKFDTENSCQDIYGILLTLVHLRFIIEEPEG